MGVTPLTLVRGFLLFSEFEYAIMNIGKNNEVTLSSAVKERVTNLDG